jgi:hypothetical protein
MVQSEFTLNHLPLFDDEKLRAQKVDPLLINRFLDRHYGFAWNEGGSPFAQAADGGYILGDASHGIGFLLYKITPHFAMEEKRMRCWQEPIDTQAIYLAAPIEVDLLLRDRQMSDLYGEGMYSDHHIAQFFMEYLGGMLAMLRFPETRAIILADSDAQINHTLDEYYRNGWMARIDGISLPHEQGNRDRERDYLRTLFSWYIRTTEDLALLLALNWEAPLSSRDDLVEAVICTPYCRIEGSAVRPVINSLELGRRARLVMNYQRPSLAYTRDDMPKNRQGPLLLTQCKDAEAVKRWVVSRCYRLFRQFDRSPFSSEDRQIQHLGEIGFLYYLLNNGHASLNLRQDHLNKWMNSIDHIAWHQWWERLGSMKAAIWLPRPPDYYRPGHDTDFTYYDYIKSISKMNDILRQPTLVPLALAYRSINCFPVSSPEAAFLQAVLRQSDNLAEQHDRCSLALNLLLLARKCKIDLK